MERLIKHIIVIWDESDHVSKKRAEPLANEFYKAYLNTFPEGGKTSESPMILSTSSPMFKNKPIQKFLHKGKFIPYSGKNKDIAIVKYCSVGIVDQDEQYRFVVDGVREQRYENNEPPIVADQACLVIFITSDRAGGMTDALSSIFHDETTKTRVNFITIRSKKYGRERMMNAGSIVGSELKKRFVRHEHGCLVLNVEQNV